LADRIVLSVLLARTDRKQELASSRPLGSTKRRGGVKERENLTREGWGKCIDGAGGGDERGEMTMVEREERGETSAAAAVQTAGTTG
jgi:hypothetical protein